MQETSRMNLKSSLRNEVFVIKLNIKKTFPVFTCSLEQQNNVTDTSKSAEAKFKTYKTKNNFWTLS